jgi:16S rRNA (uracil1498-N3)-methyltransferase
MPRPPRFFISPEQAAGHSITITGEDVRHIAVLRMESGDELLISDGQGMEYAVRIMGIDRTTVRTEIISEAKRETASPRVTLGQGIPKSDKMDLIVQKATELGVSALVPLVTERTIVKIRDEEKRIGRWQKIAREAAMQSSRPDIPLIEPVRSFRDYVSSLNPGPGTLLLFPWEEGTEPVKNVLKQNPDAGNIVVLVGPEGGFSGKEANEAKSRGLHPVSLGPNILRTETAAIAVLSMIGYEYR